MHALGTECMNRRFRCLVSRKPNNRHDKQDFPDFARIVNSGSVNSREEVV
jgi:hypothetical protein